MSIAIVFKFKYGVKSVYLTKYPNIMFKDGFALFATDDGTEIQVDIKDLIHIDNSRPFWKE